MRYALLYFSHYFAYGVYGPYLTLYLGRDLGFSQMEIGWIQAAVGLTALAGPFLWGPLAERTGRRRAMLATAFIVSAALYPMYLWTGSLATAMIPTVLMGALFMPIIPLFDDVTMRHVRETNADYGHIRLWGSLAFIVGSLSIGWMMDRVPLIQFPAFVVAEMIAVLIILRFPSRDLDYRAEKVRDLHFWRALSGSFILFLVAAFVGRVSTVGHYAFYSLFLEEIGASDSMKGIAWSLGVVAEIAMMLVAGRIVRKTGAYQLFLWGLFGSGVRFALYAAWPTIPGALVGQLFHSLSFGAMHIGAIMLIMELAPAGRTGTGQMAYAALCIGLGNTFGNPLAGLAADMWGYTGMYLASSVLAFVSAAIFAPLIFRRKTAVHAV